MGIQASVIAISRYPHLNIPNKYGDREMIRAAAREDTSDQKIMPVEF
jgi:hypothetical protein